MAKKKQEAKLQAKIQKAAADGKISGGELQQIMRSGYGQADVAAQLAPFAISNPNVALGKQARQISGVKVKDNVATYTPTTTPTYYAGVLGERTPTPNSRLFVQNSAGGYTYIGNKQAPMPAPAAEAPAAAPTAAPQMDVTASPESMQYRAEAEQYMNQADAMLNQFKIEQQRADEARKLQEQMKIQSQATLAANMARSGLTPNLQIGGASGTPKTAGTQSFKRRKGLNQTASQALSNMTATISGGLNI